MALEDYNIIYKGKERFYKCFLSNNKKADMENTRPELTVINNEEFEINSWVNLLPAITKYLLDKKYITEQRLLEFNVNWYDKTLFSKVKLTNFKEVIPDLFVNTNLGSIRSYWLICDLVYFSGVDLSKCYMIIKRFGISEPKEVRDYYINENIELYKKSLIDRLQSVDAATRYIDNLKFVDKYIDKVSKTTVSIFLIDNIRLLYTTKIDLLKIFKQAFGAGAKYQVAEKVLNDYYEFKKADFKK